MPTSVRIVSVRRAHTQGQRVVPLMASSVSPHCLIVPRLPSPSSLRRCRLSLTLRGRSPPVPVSPGPRGRSCVDSLVVDIGDTGPRQAWEKGGSSSLLAQGEMQRFNGRARGGLAAPIVARRRHDGDVAGALLGGRESHAGVEQVGDDEVDTCQGYHAAYRSPPSRRSHSRALRLADSRLCAM